MTRNRASAKATGTRTLVLPLTRPPLTANDQRRAHWAYVAQAKRKVALLVMSAANSDEQFLPQFQSCRVSVTWFAPDARRRDSDSLGPFLKASLDALVTAGVLRDDCPPHVLSTTLAVEVDRERPRIEITLTEEPLQGAL